MGGSEGMGGGVEARSVVRRGGGRGGGGEVEGIEWEVSWGVRFRHGLNSLMLWVRDEKPRNRQKSPTTTTTTLFKRQKASRQRSPLAEISLALKRHTRRWFPGPGPY